MISSGDSRREIRETSPGKSLLAQLRLPDEPLDGLRARAGA
jgi:hypothetical protein